MSTQTASVSPARSRQSPPVAASSSGTPHRLSIDVDDAMYRALRITAAEQSTTVVALVRSAIATRLGG